ncbi:fungal specific transcription factor domain-containing protein [Aspergillus alliaceus]|uniref:fungal specific transcription factor domain-containing protein n=1 Tax=Petromyces alliaceus TaxID=209559 RepID=UPI0012A45086|nr:uncharacterized protein BDW43DRAFT_308986 [Aspergillus alliaceus]KAB8235651.1 hypothetical protein BDW43DRAFT_308986 [Aspergillus alliaceus]
MALELGLNKQRFALENENGGVVLEESWRGTWWQIYVTDAHITGSTHTFPFRTSNVEMDVDLPCKEDEYEAGKIPRPRSLQGYEMREFSGDDSPGLSSFAELARLTRSLDLALASRQLQGVVNAQATCANLDATPHGMAIFVAILEEGYCPYVIDVHRQLSMLEYTPIESIAHCVPPPQIAIRGYNTQDRHLHTAKVLRAIKQSDKLLTLPTNIAAHTPFIICMISNITVAHLSACRFVVQGQQLRPAR